MTKKPERRDLKKYPLNLLELEAIKKILRSQERRMTRAAKLKLFMERAQKNNTERGISPKKVHRDV